MSLELIGKIKKAYKKYVLPSRFDYFFHFLFAFQVTYLLQILIFIIEQGFKVFDFASDQGLILFFIGLAASLIIVTFLLYRLFHWLDDVDETHNQFALGFGVIAAIITFSSLQNFDIDLNFLWVDLLIVFSSILLNALIFWTFTTKLLLILRNHLFESEN